MAATCAPYCPSFFLKKKKIIDFIVDLLKAIYRLGIKGWMLRKKHAKWRSKQMAANTFPANPLTLLSLKKDSVQTALFCTDYHTFFFVNFS